MFKLLSILITAMTLITALAVFLNKAMLQHEKESATDYLAPDIAENTRPVSTQEIEFLKQLDLSTKYYNDKQFLLALQKLDLLETNIAFSSIRHKSITKFYTLKGLVHWELWHHVEAERAWREALKYSNDSGIRRHLNKLINHNHLVIEEINNERSKRTEYHASPFQGPAKKLDGKIVFIYIFLQDGGGGRWTGRDRNYVLDRWRSGQQWLKENTAQYGSEINFIQRSYVIARNPGIKRLKVGGASSNYANANKVAYLVAEHFGFNTLSEFSEKIKIEENADQVIVFLHLPRDARSFASRCMSECPDFGEFVFLMEEPRKKNWQSLEYAQTHEALHVFGADDLYNIVDAKYYSPRDIMNYPSSFLKSSTLEPITAYAIGLISSEPETPFSIKTHSK